MIEAAYLVQEVKEKERVTTIPRLFRRRTRSGMRVRRHGERDFPVGIETGVWRPVLGCRVITHGWKMKPGRWMRSLW